MPLVRTPMIAPTEDVRERARRCRRRRRPDLVVEAIVHKPVRIATRLGIFGAVCHAIAPKLTQVLLNTAFNMFPDSRRGAGQEGRRAAAAVSRSRWRSRRSRRGFTGSGRALPALPGPGRSAASVRAIASRSAEQRVVTDADQRDVVGAGEPRRASAARPSSRATTRATRSAAARRIGARCSSASHGIAGPQLRERRAVTAATRARCRGSGVPIVISARTLAAAVACADTRARRARPCCARRRRPARAPVAARIASIFAASWSANVSIDASGGPYDSA